MITRVHIQGYKSLRDVQVDLRPLSILFGPNAAGKSNFLDALQLLSRMATSRTLKEAFDPPYRGNPLESFSFDHEGIGGVRSKQRSRFSIEVDVQLSPATIDSVNRQIQEMRSPKADGGRTQGGEGGNGAKASQVREHFLRYRVEVEIIPQSAILRVSDERLLALKNNGEPKISRIPFLGLVDNQLRLRMEGQAHPTYHDRFIDHTILSRPLYPPHYPHMAAMKEELDSWFFYYFEPRERMRAPTAAKEVRHLGMMGEELASFLNTIKSSDPKQFAAIERALRLLIPSITAINVEVNKMGEVELNIEEGSKKISSRVVSEGTLRVLGLLALKGAERPPSLLGFEEPENGIHPRRIEIVARILENLVIGGKTQLIATTHSPILTDLIATENLFVCSKTEGDTKLISFKTWGDLGKTGDINRALLDPQEPAVTVSERILRGDFDG